MEIQKEDKRWVVQKLCHAVVSYTQPVNLISPLNPIPPLTPFYVEPHWVKSYQSLVTNSHSRNDGVTKLSNAFPHCNLVIQLSWKEKSSDCVYTNINLHNISALKVESFLHLRLVCFLIFSSISFSSRKKSNLNFHRIASSTSSCTILFSTVLRLSQVLIL